MREIEKARDWKIEYEREREGEKKILDRDREGKKKRKIDKNIEKKMI